MKVLNDMLSASSGTAYTKSPPKKVILDSHHWDRYDLNLYYRGKKLFLELCECTDGPDGEDQKEIGQWAFCSGSRHLERVRVEGGLTIDVAYRPAHIAVNFSKNSTNGFLRRFINSMDRVHWSEYQLRPDGMVSIKRPREEIVVG